MRHARLCVRRKLYSIALLLSFIGTCGWAQSRIASNETPPASVVQEYCRLDFEGARLSSQNPDNERISELVTWHIEPGWDTSVVIRTFEIVSTSLGPRKSSVTVRYIVLGNMFGAKITPPRQHEELVTFVLTKSRNAWRIERPLIVPHASVPATISETNSLLIDEKDPEQIKRLKAAVDVLTKWKREAGSGKER
jgi:hypothetical protein